MGRNIEVKARLRVDKDDLIRKIESIADGPSCCLIQEDVFFSCPTEGRLKLRIEQVFLFVSLVFFSNRAEHSRANQASWFTTTEQRSLHARKLNCRITRWRLLKTLKVWKWVHWNGELSSFQMIKYRPTCFHWGFYDPLMSSSTDGASLLEHDRAVRRANRSKYEIPRTDSDYFVGRIPPQCDESQLEKIFPSAERIDLIRDRVTKESRCYAFVKGSIDLSKEYRFDQKVLLVEKVASKHLIGWKPRRLGGGLGGHKSSGQARFGGSFCPFKKVARHKFNVDLEQRWNFLVRKSNSIKEKRNRREKNFSSLNRTRWLRHFSRFHVELRWSIWVSLIFLV